MTETALKRLENAVPGEGANDAPGLGIQGSILVVDDEPGIRSFLQRSLAKSYPLVEVAENVERAEALRQRCHFDLIILDIRLPGKSGAEWLEELRGQGIRTEVIFMTAYADLETAIIALRAGASDFILKPFRLEQMLASVRRCLEQRWTARENFLLRRQVQSLFGMDGMVGHTQAMRDVAAVIQRVSPTPSTVLIEGESGTGKELVARSIHRNSGRKGPFVPMNCGSISAELLESELFGHAKGAFTGAHAAREGLFSYANGGTLFLDEIGEMPLSMQAKLLRVLEERAIRPVGTDREVPVDVRILAATNRRLADEVAAGHFREDLFYRLNVLTVTVPPLRERVADIPDLVRFFVGSLSRELGVPALEFRDEDLRRLTVYSWPGNVRELRNVIERALLLGKPPGDCLVGAARGAETVEAAAEQGYSLELPLEEVEKRHMLAVLQAAEGNKSEAARRLGVSRKTLERKLQAWGEG